MSITNEVRRVEFAKRPPRRHVSMARTARGLFDGAANLAALAAGAAIMVVASPLVAILAAAAAGAVALKRVGERDLGAVRLASVSQNAKGLPPPPIRAALFAGRLPRRQLAANDCLYFSARCFAAQADGHVIQAALVDDRGNVVFSAMGRRPGPAPGLALEPPEDLVVEPLEADVFDALLAQACRAATLITYGRVLQSGLLPDEIRKAAASIDCVWRRFLRVTRQRGLPFDRGQPLTLPDAMALAGLAPPQSCDAAIRALAIRDLWTWLDRFELEVTEPNPA